METNTYLALLTGAMTALTLVIVFYQVLLQHRQTRLMERQNEVIDKEDEILSRRAELYVVGKSQTSSGITTLSFMVVNIGDRVVREFNWHLWLPEDLMEGESLRDSEGKEIPTQSDRVSIGDAGPFKAYSGHWDTRTLFMWSSFVSFSYVILQKEIPRGMRQGMYRLVTEDAAFPEKTIRPRIFQIDLTDS